ncbi:hypothetical protein [Kordiimonas marina]|uniref:hypothetical protein n=1 Tax=Kordiimonas marina TaxID=2872312 RepID=UPI001FF1F1AB|nr:hypothetical protein [Kordiimonas marina]MCJ9427812.1 hypothetical protein [Kordiimonas marina]
MTFWLLLVAGVLWGILVFLVARFVAHTRLSRIVPFIVPIVALIGAYPLVSEYWAYASFQDWCSTHAGWSRFKPVTADTILLEARGIDIKNALLAQTVRNVLFRNFPAAENGENSLLGIEKPKNQLPEQGEVCQPKIVRSEGKVLDAYGPYSRYGLTAYGLALQLRKRHICLSFEGDFDEPQFRVHLWRSPGAWYKKTDQPPSVDRVFQLFDAQSGELLSEYKFATGPHGWLIKSIWPNSWPRYNCGAQAFHSGPFEGRWNGSLTWFLEKALLPKQS